MRVIGIDPGPRQSGWCEYDVESGGVVESGNSDNQAILSRIRLLCAADRLDGLHVEMASSYGRAVGKDVFYPLVWIGRFAEAAGSARLVTRRDVCQVLCGTTNTTKAGVWAAVCDLYGGREKAVGKKASPGPLYGVKGHARDAVAVVRAILAGAPTVESEVFG